jgi:hypothetical protein
MVPPKSGTPSLRLTCTHRRPFRPREASPKGAAGSQPKRGAVSRSERRQILENQFFYEDMPSILRI